MKRPGRVLHVIKSKMILVKANIAPPINSKVFDSKGREVGFVYDVFGPIKSPYILVKTKNDSEIVKHEARGRLFFISSSRKRRSSSWRGMRRK